jgi:hypothetical protein
VQGIQGEVGPQGDTGADGSTGSASTYLVVNFSDSVSKALTLTAMCNSGDLVIGGYARGESVKLFGSSEAVNDFGGASIGDQGWTAHVVPLYDPPRTFYVAAMCITP